MLIRKINKCTTFNAVRRKKLTFNASSLFKDTNAYDDFRKENRMLRTVPFPVLASTTFFNAGTAVLENKHKIINRGEKIG